MPRSRYRVQCDPCPHFLTATVNYWMPLFTRPETVNIILDSRWFPSSSLGTQSGKLQLPVYPRHTGIQPCPEAVTASNATRAHTS